MSTIAVNAITNAAGGNTAQINGMTPTADSLQGFRNRLINGNMVIDQRNAGAAVTGSGFAVDRFQTVATSITSLAVSSQQVSDAPSNSGFNFSYKYTVTTAATAYSSGGRTGVLHRVEGNNTADFMFGTANAKAITLSFWVKSSISGTYSVGILNNDSTRAYPATYQIASANTWEYKTITIPGETSGTWLTDNGRGIQIEFCLGADASRLGTANAWNSAFVTGSTGTTLLSDTLNATWQITGVQLEAGSVATPFERRPYGTELALCQRYLPAFNFNGTNQPCAVGVAYSTSASVMNLIHPVLTRVAPTGISVTGAFNSYTNTGNNSGNFSSITLGASQGTYSSIINCTGGSGLAQGNATLLLSPSGDSQILLTGCEL
jgi:hypothetical protein